ncbi:hypothetical protein DV737_g3698, partial [Chaetothyriales sp. CBS 132003]
MLDTTRRRTLAYLNSLYIYGRIPLLHSLIFLIEMVCTIRLMATFNACYAKKPLLTTMITNAKPARISPTLSPNFSGPAPFDFERLTRFMSYGFLWAPAQFKWFGLLTRLFPITPGRGTVPALQRVAMDQLIFAPVGLAVFFTFMTVAEGGGRKHVVKKFQDIYMPTLRANYLLWPAVQILNFRIIPLPLQIPFVSTIGIAWTAYLSLSNSAEDDSMDA